MQPGIERLGLLADFNTQNLAVLLKKTSPANIQCIEAPFGQTGLLLADTANEFWSQPCDTLVVWTLPQIAVPSFGKVLAGDGFSAGDLIAEVDVYCGLLKRIPADVRTVIVPSWIAPGVERGLGPINMANNVGIANALMRMNLRLADQFENDKRFVLLDAQAWVGAVGPTAYNSRLWYRSKTPFQHGVFQEAACDILSALDGVRGRQKKILVLDLDNTLWGGVVGDVGWENLRLGGHDPIGEAFVDFQKALRQLVNRGFLLAIVSKNEEAAALEAIRRHPEMVLRLEDFAGWKINWQDKAQNVAELISDLNLGTDSAVFLDDSPVERARVKEALPQVLVPEFPEDPMQYASFLGRLRCFDNVLMSREDRDRSSMYAADRKRTALKTTVPSLAEWLRMLDLRVHVETLGESNLERATQLFNKTNQMNLATRRLAASELLSWAERDDCHLWTFRVSDKFGDYGLCGICSIEQTGSRAKLSDFLLSCRVMARGVEETMLMTAAREAQNLGCIELEAEYLPTAKNQPCERWLQSQKILAREKNVFRFSLANALSFPEHVKLSTSVNEKIPAQASL